MNSISIIIPVLNEAEHIGLLLKHLKAASDPENVLETIVVDGGSTDETEYLVKQFQDVDFISSERGRAKQMNKGAEFAKGDILYFLHADSFPPARFDNYILNEVSKRNLAGCFRLKFDHDHWWLRLAGWLTRFKWRACRGGDQSQFITKALFDELGGFDENLVILEDNDLIDKLYARNEFVVIQKPLKTSARCYRKNGVWRLQYHFWTIYIKRWFGASPKSLQEYYKRNIA